MNRRTLSRLLAGLILCAPLWATTTTVTQTLVGPDGLPASGTVYIRITAACSYAGSYVGTKTVALRFGPSGSPAATTFSTALVPNVASDGTLGGSGGCAGTSYTVSWVFTGGQAQPVETWLVPVSATPVSIDAVKTGPLPAPATQINPSQISTAGGTIGQAMCLTVSGWAAGACGGGGGGGMCLTTVPYSAAPTFNFATCTQQEITLSGNVTPVIQGAGYCQVAGGCTITFIQGSAGGYAVIWTGAVTGGFALGTVANRHNIQNFTSLDGSTLLGITPGEINQ